MQKRAQMGERRDMEQEREGAGTYRSEGTLEKRTQEGIVTYPFAV